MVERAAACCLVAVAACGGTTRSAPAPAPVHVPPAEARPTGPTGAAPSAGGSVAPEETADSAITVAISSTGQLYLGEEAVTEEELGPLVRSRGITRVAVAADQTITYQRVVELLDLLRRHGVTSLSLAVQAPGNPAPATPAWSCRGSIDATATRALVASHRAEVARCHEDALRQDAGLADQTVRVEVRIAADGTVEVVVTGAQPASFGDCIRDEVRTWRFPAPTGGGCAVVAVPFAFHRP